MGRRQRGFEMSKWGALSREIRRPTGVTEGQRTTRVCMLTKEQSGDVFDRIRKFSSADEVEVLFSGGRFALTRFANNIIHQNMAGENHLVLLRTGFGGMGARGARH